MARYTSLDNTYDTTNTATAPTYTAPPPVAPPTYTAPPPTAPPLPPTYAPTVTLPPMSTPLPPQQPTYQMPPLSTNTPPTGVTGTGWQAPVLSNPLPPQQIGQTPPLANPLPPLSGVAGTGGGGGGTSGGLALDPTTGIPVPAGVTIDPTTGLPAAPRAPNGFGPAQTVQEMLNAFINGEYANNARQRGAEYAASRGLLNSNIAAGASHRAALESVQPFVAEGMNLLGNREQRAFQGQENQLDRIQGVNNMILGSNIQERQMQIANALEQGNMTLAAQLQKQNAMQDFEFRRLLQNDSVAQQDWLSSNAFSRQFNANLSMLPVTSSMDMMNFLMQLGSQDPEVYTPQIMAGMQNFFQQNLMGILSQFFPNMMTQPPAGGTP